MRPKWPKLASLAQKNLHTLVSVLRYILCFQRITFLRTYLCDYFSVNNILLYIVVIVAYASNYI